MGGTPVYTAIRFAGVINEENVDDLLEAVNSHCMMCDDGPETENIMAEHLAYELYDSECTYADLSTIEETCERLGVSYCKRWEGEADVAPGMQIYNAVVGVTMECGTVDGEPAVTLSDLEKAGSPEDLIGYLKAFNDFEKNYGTLEIKPLEDVDEAA